MQITTRNKIDIVHPSISDESKDPSFTGAPLSSSNKNRSEGKMEKSSSTRPSPTKQASFKAVVNVSNMQASFAERTATEMGEIVDWYKKYEGSERFKKENRQSQSMPDNAMIVDDDRGNTFEYEIHEESKTACGSVYGADDSEDQRGNDTVCAKDSVVVKDFYTPAQGKKSGKALVSVKTAPKHLISTVRSISKAEKCDDPPPRAIKIPADDEESVVSALTTRSTKRTNALSADSRRYSQNMQDKIPFCDEEEEVLAMLSPTGLAETDPLVTTTDEFPDKEEEVLAMLSPIGCAEIKSQTMVETQDDYRDEEQDVLAMLSSNVSEKRGNIASSAGKATESQSNDGGECNSTEHEVQSQIEAADDLIRNTQNMAEIILQLRQSSSTFLNVDADDDENIVNIYDIDANPDDDNTIITSPTFDSVKICNTLSPCVSHSSLHDQGTVNTYSTGPAHMDDGLRTHRMTKTEPFDQRGTKDRLGKGTRVRILLRKISQKTLSLSNHSVASTKKTSLKIPKKNRAADLQLERFYNCVLPILISVVLGLILKLITT